MSSPAPGPVGRTRRRSLAGPVVLIVMGVVFLMGTMGVLHWYMLGRLFAHYWPLLIILWGVVKLIEHQQAQREGTRASGISIGGVFLLCCLIVAGLISTQASRVNWSGLHDQIGWDDEDFGSLFGNTYSFTDQSSPTRHGDINVTGRDGSLDISSQRGEVMAEDINGSVSLNLQHSSAKVSHVSGDVTVDGRVNDLTVSNVKGATRLTGEFMESVHLS